MSRRVPGFVLRGLRRAPRPFFVSALLLVTAATAGAQDPMRPWRAWRTIATPNYRFHYLPEYEQWVRDIAARVESVDSALTSFVGFRTPTPIHVVVNDPFVIANGYALPFIDTPVTVWWATPPDPRSGIGNFRTWGEILAVHELAHLAHLTRPSRNALRRQLWASLPVNLGPITRRAPRWAYEGYATLVEGRLTGSGRPNNVWRPAILRQWAIEGRLPTYAQLANWSDFNGGDFAYLGGSAFLEWLSGREGDSSLVHVWRRLTARRQRTFEAAFAGVYGDNPALLYGRHIAELTRDAMAARTRLERDGLIEGELEQRLSWETGDPAISPDGQRVALTLRERERPGRLVVWTTAPEPEDTAAIRRRIQELKRDPQDVPDRTRYPRQKKPVKTLYARNGRSYQHPRWFSDNRRVLVTRWMQLADGTQSPGLYVWNTETGVVRQLTNGVGVLHGDPHPSGNDAVAMQCHWGHCDIARVDLERGVMTTLLEGNAGTSYYRPRYAPDGSRFAASINEDGRWGVVVSDTLGKVMRRVGPGDGANRYDAQWMGSDSLVVVSERGGIANLEILGAEGGAARTLTRVTGAAVGPDVNRADGSVWFLSLHSLGFDVRRVPRAGPRADSVIAISREVFGFAGATTPRTREFAEQPVAPPRPYGGGPRHARWFPGGYASADGAGVFMTVFSGDIVGRFNATATGAYGERGTWQGGSLRFAWRFPRPALEFGADAFIHEPSLGGGAQPAAPTLDATLSQAMLAAVVERQGEGWRFRARLGGASGSFAPVVGASFLRSLVFAEGETQRLQSHGSRGLLTRLRVRATHGSAPSPFQRFVGSLQLATTGRDAMPLELGVTAGRVDGAPHPFELFAVGGGTSPVGDSALLGQRHAMPMFPTAASVGNRLLAWRIALPSFWTAFYEGAATTMDDFVFEKWHRAVGLETRFSLPPIPVAFTPRVQLRAGAAYALDEPFKKKIRGFIEMKYEP